MGGLSPLFLNAVVGTPDEEVERNIRYTLSKDYRPFNSLLPDAPLDRPVSIVGSAPSLATSHKELVGDIITINQSHDYLVERGIKPTWGVLWDTSEMLADFITPAEGVKYLIASRCDPKTIDKFLPHDTYIWHPLGDACLPPLLEESGRFEPMLGGGAQGVTRMMFVAHTLGYRDIHLFGADSSCEEDAHVVPNPQPQKYIDVFCAGKWWRTTPQLASQVYDLKLLAPMLQKVGARITIHGDGLLQAYARANFHAQPLEALQ